MSNRNDARGTIYSRTKKDGSLQIVYLIGYAQGLAKADPEICIIQDLTEDNYQPRYYNKEKFFSIFKLHKL